MRSIPYHNIVLFIISSLCVLPNVYNSYIQENYLKRSPNHISNVKFDNNEYNADYPDNNESEKEQSWDSLSVENLNNPRTKIDLNHQKRYNLSTVWDSKWAASLKFGQVSAVDIDPDGNIAIFHRGNRTWNRFSFDMNNRFNLQDYKDPIKENTIILLNKSGDPIFSWGKNLFYMPHGLTIDHLGNYWITDVAMHLVLKFNIENIREKKDLLTKDSENTLSSNMNIDNPFESSVLKPSLILGKAFEPGSDNERFCKPTAVAVMKNGDFFVSDGYCNSRIVKFNSRGNRILTWGRNSDIQIENPPPNSMSLPHALALAENLNYLFVADRENGRILCFYSSNGTFHKEYKNKIIGDKIYSVAYAKEKIYLVNGPGDLGRQIPIRGFTVDINTDKVISEFAPGREMSRPHDIAVSDDGHEIYVVELDSGKISRFIQDTYNSRVKSVSANSKNTGIPVSVSKPAALSDVKISKTSNQSSHTLASSLIISSLVFIVFCLLLAAVISRCRKQGNFLMYHRADEWNMDKKDDFKLSSLLINKAGHKFKFLERRPNKRDFSKVNTDPETSDEEQSEYSLTKTI